MERRYGTCVFGIRTPIIEKGDDLIKIAVDSTLQATDQLGLNLSENDILGLTESVVARSLGNYASLSAVGADIKNKFGKDATIGIVHPILSRNRFASILKGIALGAKKVYVLLNHVDEQGNALSLNGNIFHPDTNFYSVKEYTAKYGKPKHSITKQDYIELYESMGKNIEVFVASDPAEILRLTKNVIACTIHTRDALKDYLIERGATKAITLADILNKPVNGSGFNTQFGIMGSNLANADLLKLFPSDCDKFVKNLQTAFRKRIGVSPEIMVYGDGAYKDPDTGIWELADPVVSPGWTKRLGEIGTGDTKFKNVVDERLANLPKAEKEKQLNKIIAENRSKASDGEMGTTPRRLNNLVGSLMDLTSGSGNKGTPLVLVHGYFDTRVDQEIQFKGADKQMLIEKELEKRKAKLEYEGKSKNIYALPNGNILLTFGDGFTGANGVEDPGANHNIGTKEGLGKRNLAISTRLFDAISSSLKVPTHNVSVDLELGILEAKRAETLGKGFKFTVKGKEYTAFGLEFIARNKAWGSFLKRFTKAKQGDSLLEKDGSPFVEVSVKNDDAGDPFFTREHYVANGIKSSLFDTGVKYTASIGKYLTKLFAKNGLELIDFKIEFGVDKNGNLLLIDELSPGSLRALKNGKTLTKEEIYETLINSKF